MEYSIILIKKVVNKIKYKRKLISKINKNIYYKNG